MTGWKTYAAAALAGLTGALAMTDWVAFLSNPKAGATALGMAVLMAAMRKITNGPPAV